MPIYEVHPPPPGLRERQMTAFQRTIAVSKESVDHGGHMWRIVQTSRGWEVRQTTMDGDTIDHLSPDAAHGWNKAEAVEEAAKLADAVKPFGPREKFGPPDQPPVEMGMTTRGGGAVPQFRGEPALQLGDREGGRSVLYSPRPVADVRGDELGGEDVAISDRRRRGREALADIMKQGPVQNPQLGEVQFSGAGVGRTLRDVAPAKLALIPHLRDIIAAGDLIRSGPSYKPSQNVKAYHTLITPVRIGGVDHEARVVIREDNNGKFYYDFEKSETPLVPRDVSPGPEGRTLTQPATTEPLSGEIGEGQGSVNIDLNRSGAGDDRGLLFSPRITGAERETEAYTPEQTRAYGNVGRITNEPGWRERLAALTDDLGRRVLRATLDPYIGVKADDPAGYMALRNANTSAGAALMFLRDGTLKFDGTTYAMADRNGGVEHYLVRPLQGEQDRFLWWVAAHRAEQLTREDRENLGAAPISTPSRPPTAARCRSITRCRAGRSRTRAKRSTWTRCASSMR